MLNWLLKQNKRYSFNEENLLPQLLYYLCCHY